MPLKLGVALLILVAGVIPRSAAAIGIPAEEGRRIEVLFLGSENLFNHDPVARFRVIRKALGPRGINFTYTDTTASLNEENLASYDVLLIFANHYTIAEDEQVALLNFAREGGGCVLLHCAAGCFRKSGFEEYVELLGAQFKSHGGGVFRAEIVQPDHPLMKGWEGFEAWDETYVHQRHCDDRTILQHRDGEPWTWVKPYGEGRVFYTASGHDHRCWDQPAYHELIYRAVRWTAGDTSTSLDALALPQLDYRQAAVPKDPDNPVGPNNQLQLPLAPRESLKLAQIPVGFELRLFASEPMVVNPIAINWDSRGRLWVVEAFDYPNKVASDNPQDRIKILEDKDGDGVADSVSVFAEGLNIATSVLPMPDGAIATDGSRMIYLRDLDGDDRADHTDVLFDGLGQRDTHACTSNLRYGFDNWIYATVGYSGLDVTVAGKRHKSEMGVFRFKADGSAFEVLQNTTNNTWGLSFTEEGDVLGSTANGNPSWYLSVPNRHFAHAGLKPEKTPRADANPTIYPITADYFQNSPKEKVSSGAGHAIYTARRFPSDWWNRRALICEPPLHLVVAPTVSNRGAAFATAGFEHNLYASADAWSAPVAAEIGPDGAVWIADWYNPICNHNPYRGHHKRGKGNGFITDDRDRSHGRIYRIFPADSKPTTAPDLTSRQGAIAALGHRNLFWRLAAQRELLARHELAPEGQILIEAQKADPVSSIHALRALQGRNLLHPDALGRVAAKLLPAEGKRGLAAAALDCLPVDPSHRKRVATILKDAGTHEMVRKQAALYLAQLPADPEVGAELFELLRDEARVRGHLRTAIGLAAIQHPEGFLRRAIEEDVAPDAMQPFVGKAATADELSPGLLAYARRSETKIGALLGKPEDDLESNAELSPSAQRGRSVYLACVACHQPDGGGLDGTFPPLDGSPRIAEREDLLIKIVLKGLQGPLESGGRNFDAVMPGHESLLSDQQIADVLSYIRSAWSNRAGDVSTTAVRKVRAALAGRTHPWTFEELEADE